MLVLKMNADKALMITKRGNTYENENNAEKIKFILPKFINGNDLKDCNVFFGYVNEFNLNNTVEITELLTEHSEDTYVCESDINNLFTYKAGVLKLYIEVLRPNEDVALSLIAKSDIVEYTIFPYIDIDDTIPPQTFSLLDQMILKYEALRDEIEGIEDKATYAYVDEKVAEIYEAMQNLDPSPGGGGSDIDNEVILSIIKRIDEVEKSVAGLNIPTKTSDLTNDSGFQTSNDVEDIVASKGYVTETQVETVVENATKDFVTGKDVETIITEKDYPTKTEVEETIVEKGYQTSEQVNKAISDATDEFMSESEVNDAITSKGYQTASEVESAITSKDYQTSTQVNDAIADATQEMLTKEEAESIVEAKGYQTADNVNDIINESMKGMATETYVDNKISSIDMSAFLTGDDISNLAEKSTTLAGYGITDGVNTSQLDDAKTEVLDDAKAYVDEIIGQFINASEVAM